MAHLPTIFEKAPGLSSEHQRGLYYLRDAVNLGVVEILCRNGQAGDYNGPAAININMAIPEEGERLPMLVTERRPRVCKDVFRVIQLSLPGRLITQTDIADNPVGLQIEQFEGEFPGTVIFFPAIPRI